MPKNKTTKKGSQVEAAQLAGQHDSVDMTSNPLSFGFDAGNKSEGYGGFSPADITVAETIKYGSTVVLQHDGTKARLHSHVDKYPGGSKQQQVTGWSGKPGKPATKDSNDDFVFKGPLGQDYGHLANLLLNQTPKVSGSYDAKKMPAVAMTNGKRQHKGEKDFWHSAGATPWAEIPLSESAIVHTVRLWNRGGNDKRINGAMILGRDTEGKLHPCGEPLQTTGPGGCIVRRCTAQVPFSSIRVELNASGKVFLQIVELEAYASKGRIVRNGDVVRLEHIRTKHHLHSHKLPAHTNPGPEHHEVSCFQNDNGGDNNDNWRVECGKGSLTMDQPFRLIHVATGAALHSHSRNYAFTKFPQQEVTTRNPGDTRVPGDTWSVIAAEPVDVDALLVLTPPSTPVIVGTSDGKGGKFTIPKRMVHFDWSVTSGRVHGAPDKVSWAIRVGDSKFGHDCNHKITELCTARASQGVSVDPKALEVAKSLEKQGVKVGDLIISNSKRTFLDPGQKHKKKIKHFDDDYKGDGDIQITWEHCKAPSNAVQEWLKSPSGSPPDPKKAFANTTYVVGGKGIEFNGKTFVGINFQGSRFEAQSAIDIHAGFYCSLFVNCNFSRCTFVGCQFTDGMVLNPQFSQARFIGPSFQGCRFMSNKRDEDFEDYKKRIHAHTNEKITDEIAQKAFDAQHWNIDFSNTLFHLTSAPTKGAGERLPQNCNAGFINFCAISQQGERPVRFSGSYFTADRSKWLASGITFKNTLFDCPDGISFSNVIMEASYGIDFRNTEFRGRVAFDNSVFRVTPVGVPSSSSDDAAYALHRNKNILLPIAHGLTFHGALFDASTISVRAISVRNSIFDCCVKGNTEHCTVDFSHVKFLSGSDIDFSGTQFLSIGHMSTRLDETVFAVPPNRVAKFHRTDFGLAGLKNVNFGVSEFLHANLSATHFENTVLDDAAYLAEADLLPMTRGGDPWPDIDGYLLEAQETALKVAKASGYLDEVNTAEQRHVPKEQNYSRVADGVGGVAYIGMGPVLHYARSTSYESRQLTAHVDEIEFVIGRLERLADFELTRQNWSEYLSAWSSLQNIFLHMNRIVKDMENSKKQARKRNLITPNRRVYDNLRKLLYPEEMVKASDEAANDDPNLDELRSALEPDYGEFGNCLKSPKQAIATLRRLRPCFGKVGPPVSMLNAARNALGRLLCGPYYATIVRELNLELADIKVVTETKNQAASLASFAALSAGIGTSNFLARLAYDYSELNPYADE
jgi:uncharacterized protein YjbI with pentapeptide repeats